MAPKEKTHNSGQWTQGRFDSFIRSALRGAFRRWPPKYEAIKSAYVGTKLSKSKRQAKHYQCSICGGEYTQREIQVDHIVPIGSLYPLEEYVDRLFCEADNLQIACVSCHKKKTKAEREAAKNED